MNKREVILQVQEIKKCILVCLFYKTRWSLLLQKNWIQINEIVWVNSEIMLHDANKKEDMKDSEWNNLYGVTQTDF